MGLLLAGVLSVASARVEAAAEGDGDGLLAAVVGGSPTVNVRARLETANQEGGPDGAHALTVRTRLGYGTRTWRGFSLYADMEHIEALDRAEYNDTQGKHPEETMIADPEHTGLNQAFLRYDNADWFGSSLVVGRQRIMLDDVRFVGNVGWRQNEQTFDALTAGTSLDIESLELLYSYVWRVNRIFGNQLTPDFQGDSHFLNLRYEDPGCAVFQRATFFAYLLDFDKGTPSPASSSNTFGLRLAGGHSLGDDLKLSYVTSVAVQSDSGLNPVDYKALYFLGEGSLDHKRRGRLVLGFELLGSDDGKATFLTPLATLHKWNGWADVFLNNGGANGLRDLYASFSPKLPAGWHATLAYHHFWRDEGSRSIGDEFDALLKKSFNGHVSGLLKFALFNGNSSNAPGINVRDLCRFWIQIELKI